MYLFTRSRSADPSHMPEAMAFAVDIAHHVTKVTGVEIYAWHVLYGAPMGSLSWSGRAESLAAVASMNAQLLADADYLGKVQDANHLFAGPAESGIVEILHTTGLFTPSHFTNIITAQCAPGRIGEAMAWAVEAQEASSKLTGLAGGVGRTLYGPFASVGWMTPLETIEQVEAADQAFKDPDFGKMIDAAGPLFIPGATHSRLIEQVG